MAPRMRIALPAYCLVLLAVGCGGSSSETPPPLEPDPTLGRYTGPRLPSAEDDAPAPSLARDPELEAAPTLPTKPARATWGSGKPAPAPAPTMTSPNALPPGGGTTP